jgi:hypothetical protein
VHNRPGLSDRAGGKIQPTNHAVGPPRDEQRVRIDEARGTDEVGESRGEVRGRGLDAQARIDGGLGESGLTCPQFLYQVL